MGRFSRLFVALLILSAGIAFSPWFALPTRGFNWQQYNQYGNARLRVMHAVPKGPAVDLRLDDALFFANISYRGNTGYLYAAPGQHTLRVMPGGSNTPLTETSLTLDPGRDYTVVALGPPEQLQLPGFQDDNVAPAAGQVRVNVIHAALNAPATLDVCLAGRDCPFGAVAFKQKSSTISLEAGTYTLEVIEAGRRDVVLNNTPNVRFEAGGIYTLMIMGIKDGDPGLQLITHLGDGQPPLYPPVNGVFLSPQLLTVVGSGLLILLLLGGGLWLVRR
jgi:hypothetical protein